MSDYVVDTSAFIAFVDGNDAIVRSFHYAGHLYVPVISYGELVFGYRSGSRFTENVERLHKYLAANRVHLVPIDQAIADTYGELRYRQKVAGKPLAENDLWIAATAIHLDRPLLTLDSDFNRVEGLNLGKTE
jgi:tRNA(fMet)-specific endonuclease VapC